MCSFQHGLWVSDNVAKRAGQRELKTTSGEVRKIVLGQRVCPHPIQTQGHKTRGCIVFQNSIFGTQSKHGWGWFKIETAPWNILTRPVNSTYLCLRRLGLLEWLDLKGITMSIFLAQIWNNSSAAQISFPAMWSWMLQIKLAPVIHFQNMFSLNSLTLTVRGSLQLETKINFVDLLNVHFHPSWFKRSLWVLHFKRRSAPLC